MPAQKRSYDNSSIPPPDDAHDSPQRQHANNHHHHHYAETSAAGAAAAAAADADVDGNESDRSRSSGNEEKDEFVLVKLSDIRKEVQCPICLGIIRKTRTVMECLHRFCRECIDKAMRMGNNECPSCRTHCASRRSLRDDLNYDALIAALYPDIDKYEEEELAFQEEETTRNKQIQASIAQTFQRQTEALGRKRTAKATAAAFVRRSNGRYRDTPLGRRRNYRTTELQGSDDNEDANGDAGNNSSSADERSTEVRPKRAKRWVGARFSQSSAAGSADGGGDENDSEVNRESMGASAGLIGPSERLAWGKGGMRSHTRHGSVSGGNGKNARNNRLSKIVDYLRNLEEKDDQLDIHLMLVSFDEQRIPSLQQPYLCCRPTLSVRHLRQYVALHTALQANEIEIYLVKELHTKLNPPTSANSPTSNPSVIDLGKDKLQALDEQETLAGLKTQNFSQGQLLLAYQKNLSN
ncbi:putative E3 ubiquitin-protein ligase RING1a [Pistacia vera]|uniref:putative E3 ubiquitin-protein ligase RING1a n=1 Tax=Pistacia vera TaxID=55513 RepID=UPI001262B357|nr:putative E3 ubiquitin-protein ligase RING1a [Pistacia vera]